MGMTFSGVPANRYGIKYRTATGRYITQNLASGTTLTTFSMGSNKIYICPWVAPYTMAVDTFGVNVTTAAASSHIKIVVYDSDPVTGYPHNLLYESGSLDSSAIAAISEAHAQAFNEGQQYWIGVRSDGLPVISGDQPYTRFSLGRGNSISTTSMNTLAHNLTFATAAPATWVYDATEELSTTPNAVFMRLA